MVDVYVGLGSNVDPERHLRKAIAALRRRYGDLRCSSVYKSPAYGFTGDDFLNLVVGFETAAAAEQVEETLSAIESAGGRERRGPRFGPRSLDLDLLLYGCRVDPRQRLPRDDVLRYPFVLAPLAEIAPRLVHPLTGVSMADAWRAMATGGPRLQRLGALSEVLPAGAAAAVDGDDLTGDIRRVADQE